MESLVVSCVVDGKPPFYRQCIHWIATLLFSGTVTAEEILVHVVGDLPPAFLELLAVLGVRTVKIRSFASDDSPYCNKLMQLKSKALRAYERIVLMDTDMAVVDDLREAVGGHGLAAKVVDTSSPPLPVLQSVVRQARLAGEPATVPSDFGIGATLRGNCNGGLYVLSRDVLGELGPLWLKWAYWLLDHKRLLGAYVKHTDQIGFCLALLELGRAPELLDLSMNYPTHLKPTTYAGRHDVAPRVLHYHGHVTPAGLLRPIGLPKVDAAIARANATIAQFVSQLPARFVADGSLGFAPLA